MDGHAILELQEVGHGVFQCCPTTSLSAVSMVTEFSKDATWLWRWQGYIWLGGLSGRICKLQALQPFVKLEAPSCGDPQVAGALRALRPPPVQVRKRRSRRVLGLIGRRRKLARPVVHDGDDGAEYEAEPEAEGYEDEEPHPLVDPHVVKSSAWGQGNNSRE